MRLTQIFPVVMLPTAAAPLPLMAQTAAAQPASADQGADLTNIEAYLNGLTTAQCDFTFAAPDGSLTHGVFYLSRPAKLRFEYTEPKGNLLIADGDYVIFWDAQQKEASNLPISSTPLQFLLRPRVSLTDGVKVTRFEHAAGVIRCDPGPRQERRRRIGYCRFRRQAARAARLALGRWPGPDHRRDLFELEVRHDT